MPEYFDYVVVAFFAAFLGWKYMQTKATGHLWFMLPLLLVVGLNQGWATAIPFQEELTRATFFAGYRIVTVASCFLAFYMYWRDLRKRAKASRTEATAQKTMEKKRAKKK